MTDYYEVKYKVGTGSEKTLKLYLDRRAVVTSTDPLLKVNILMDLLFRLIDYQDETVMSKITLEKKTE